MAGSRSDKTLPFFVRAAAALAELAAEADDLDLDAAAGS